MAGVNVALPTDWEWVKLGDVARYINGRAFKPSDWASEGLPIVRIQNLTDPRASFNHYQGEVADRFYIDDGDLLVSWSASLGVHWWHRGPAILNQHIFKVVEEKEKISRSYLYHALTLVMQSLRRQAHGATMKHVTKPRFEATEIPLPTLEEQHRIVAQLESQLAAANRVRQAAQAQLDAFDAMPAALLREILPRSPSERLPLGWRAAKLGEICSFEYGKGLPRRARRPGTVPVYGSNGIVDWHDQWSATGPTIIVGRKGSVGKVHLSTGDCWPIDTTYVVRSNSNVVVFRYLRYLLEGLDLGRFQTSTAIPGLNRDVAYRLDVRLPPLDEQQRLVEKAESLLASTEQVRHAAQTKLDFINALPAAFLRLAFTA